MDFAVRRLARMSAIFRNIAFSQAYRVNIPRFCTTSPFGKDKVSHCDSESSSKDSVLKTLEQGLSPSTLLNFIDSNKHEIKREHVIAALSSLQNFYQDKSDVMINLHEQVDFAKLCTCLKPQIKKFSPNEVTMALNILQLLNVPSSNIFITTLLEHVQESIKNLSFQDIYKLSDVLDKFEATSLSKDIESDLKIQFVMRTSEIDNTNINSLIFALCFASKNLQDKETVNFFMNAVENCNSSIELSDAFEILKSLSYIKYLPCKFTNIIDQIQRVFIQNIDEITSDEIILVLKQFSSKINDNYEEFYNEAFIDSLVQKVIYENWDFVQASDILSCLNSIRHVQMDLLDYLSAKCYENPNILNLDVDLLQPLFTGLALANYKPVFWDAMKEPILSNEMSKIQDLKLCYFTLYLACLECFQPKILEKVFSTKNVISEEHLQVLLKLYQFVKILCPSYHGPWPSKDLLESFKNLQQNKNQEYPLLSALEQALGGNFYIKTNIRTTLEHYIDHVVIMNRGGYPIAINSYGSIETKNQNYDVTYLEDLIIPPGSQIFLILYVQPEWYARNTEGMLGSYSSFIKTLESTSYTVIPVNGKMWQNMSQTEKTLYIMKAIKLKFENGSVSITS